MGAPIQNLCETNIQGAGIRHGGVHASHCPALRTRGIESVGWSHIRDRYEIIRLRPTFEHLTVCVQGHGLSLCGGQWVPWEEGAVVLSPAGVPHGARSLSSRTRWSIAWIRFSPAGTSIVPSEDSTPLEPAVRRRIPYDRSEMPRGNYAHLLPLIEGLEREVRMGGAFSAAAALHWVELIGSFVDRLLLLPRQGDPRLAQLWTEVQRNPGHLWSVEELARRIHVSSTHLRRLCHAELGFGPARQLARLRLNHACLLLTTTARSVEQIAEECGYTDPFAFSTAFRRHTGKPPSQFRGRHA